MSLNGRTIAAEASPEGQVIYSEAMPVRIEARQGVPSVDMVAYSGGPLHVGGFPHPVVVDLNGLEVDAERINLLLDHQSRQRVGHAESIDVRANQVTVTGRLSASTAFREEVIASHRDGFKWHVSIGARVIEAFRVPEGRTVRVNGRTFKGPVIVAARAKLKEVSFVGNGGDEENQVRIAAEGARRKMFEEWLETLGLNAERLSEDQLTELRAAFDAHQVASGEGGDDSATDSRNRERSNNDGSRASSGAGRGMFRGLFAGRGSRRTERRDDRRRERDLFAGRGSRRTERRDDRRRERDDNDVEDWSDDIAAETARLREERAAVYEHEQMVAEVCGEDHRDIRAQAIRENWSRDRVELEVLRAQRRRDDLEAERRGRGTGVAIHSRSSEELLSNDVFACAIQAQLTRPDAAQQTVEDALQAAYGEQTYERSRRLPRSIGLHYLCEAVVRAAGGHLVFGQRLDNETWGSVVEANARLRAVALSSDLNGGNLQAAAFSTLSIPGVLSNLANKRLLDIYNEWPSLVERICGRARHQDFKQHSKYRLSGELELVEIPGSGEIDHGTMDEDTYTNQVKTRARLLAITREDFINDDLGAFDRRSQLMGNAAMRTREKDLFTLILDGVNTGFFQTSGSVINSVGTTSLDNAGLRSAKQLMGKMKSKEGNPVFITPSMVVTGVTLSDTAEEQLNFTSVHVVGDPAATSQVRVENQFRGRYGLGISPYIDAGSGINGAADDLWFLFGDRQVPAYEYATLVGSDTPMLDFADTVFNTLGFQSRIVWDYGFAEEDPRAAIRVSGS